MKHEWADAAGERFDPGGAIIYGVMLFTLIYGMLLFPDPTGSVWITAGFGTAFVFYRWEKRQTSPLIDFSVFMNNRTFVFSNIAAMINTVQPLVSASCSACTSSISRTSLQPLPVSSL